MMRLMAATMLLQCMAVVFGHGRLTRVGQGTTRIGSPDRYENDPVNSKSAAFVCRNAAATATQATLQAGGKLDIKWDFGAAHVGDCAVYLSYDVDKSRGEMNWFKIGNLPFCKNQNRQVVSIDLPDWLPAGKAVFRWDWTALHVWPSVEFYSQCSDVEIVRTSGSGSMPITYKVNTGVAYPDKGNVGVGYRNPFGRGAQFITGPSCAKGYTKNNCALTAVGTRGHTIDGGADEGGSSSNPTTPKPAPDDEKLPGSNCPTYTIKSGDTLFTIAQKYTDEGHEVTWKQICDFNLKTIENCDAIEEGQVINIPIEKCAGGNEAFQEVSGIIKNYYFSYFMVAIVSTVLVLNW